MFNSEHSEAEAYIVGLNNKIAKVVSEAHQILIGSGCTSYVKTIYIGYDFNGEMVAALYGHADYVEVAIALPETHKSSILIDASHLTWRTLPVAAVLKSKDDLKKFAPLVKESCRGVRSGSHTVLRDNEFFANAKRERKEKGVIPKRP
jgi:hypothetical protein